MVSSRKVKDCEKDEMLFIVQICLNKKNELDQIFPRKLLTIHKWYFRSQNDLRNEPNADR